MGLFGNTSTSTNISNQESNQSSVTNTVTTNETTNTNVTDNSMEMSSNVNTNTQIDSNQVINTTIQNTMSKLIQSCGMSIEQANAAVNIVKDESVNTNIDASNTFTNTGAGVTITDKMKLRLNQAIDFDGGDVDKSCVLDALNDLQTDLKSINNSTQKSIGGSVEDSVSCPICAENIPSSSAVCPICAEPLAIAQSAAPAETSHSGQNKAPDNPIGLTGENTMEEVLEELKKINKNLNLIAKHLLFD
ncbi:hypothetical protein OAJ94_04305 [Deltaproteobacteria bacterium]|nr:hypothetical protein [Deltaproteobacteria bacterium]